MNTKHISLALISLMVLGSTVTIASGPDSPPANRLLTPGKRIVLLGVFGGVGLLSHSGPFSTQESGYDCCSYDAGDGLAFGGGLRAVIPLSRQIFLLPTATFAAMDGSFDSDPFSYPILGMNNTIEDADFENTLDVTFSAVQLNVQAAYVFTSFGMYVAAGPSLSYVLSKEFTSTDRITGPSGVRFLGGGTEKEVYNGDISITQSTYFALDASIGVFLEVAPSVFINPEAGYSLPLTSMAKDEDWKVSSIRGGIGILFGL